MGRTVHLVARLWAWCPYLGWTFVKGCAAVANLPHAHTPHCKIIHFHEQRQTWCGRVYINQVNLYPTFYLLLRSLPLPSLSFRLRDLLSAIASISSEWARTGALADGLRCFCLRSFFPLQRHPSQPRHHPRATMARALQQPQKNASAAADFFDPPPCPLPACRLTGCGWAARACFL